VSGIEAALTPEAAIAQAVEIAGFDDFGPEGFREGLARSLAAFARLPLTPEARAQVHRRTVGELVTRLRIEQWFRDHPEVEDQPIEGPIFVVGMPRTGTTATVGMLALDPRFRFLRGWEGAAPLPPPVAGEEDADPRVIAARAAAKDYDKAHIHLADPDGPEEDLVFLSGLDMHAYHGAYPMPPDYIDWWIGEDFASTYAYHARVLKLLQSRRPPRLWLLKSPPHLFKLEAIVRRYPAAKFVMTHRDPLKIIPSVASLHCMLHEERCIPGSIDKAEIGRRLLAFWAEGVRRGLAARVAVGEHRFVDVRNEDVVARPIETFERIYAHLGLELGPDLRQRIGDYNSAKAPGAFGAHRYTLEEYGLSADAVRAAFSGYGERFGV
jgi:hypothetical protein